MMVYIEKDGIWKVSGYQWFLAVVVRYYRYLQRVYNLNLHYTYREPPLDLMSRRREGRRKKEEGRRKFEARTTIPSYMHTIHA